MSKIDFQGRLANFDMFDAAGHLLRRNHQRAYEIFAKHVGDDVTRQQISLLIALIQRSPSTQRELVDATGIDKSTLKEMIGRMVAKGWIVRKRDPADGRAWALEIAPAGEKMIAERMDAIEAADREIVAPLSEAEQEAFIEALRTLLGLGKIPRSN